MARRFLTNLDLTGFSLLGALMHPVTADPAGLGASDAGRLWFRTDTSRLMLWTGAAAVDVKDLATSTGSILASRISDFDTAVRTSRLDQLAAPTGPVSFGGQRLASIADPTAASDAVSRQYLDTQLAGLASGQVLKGTVKVAATTNVNLASPGASLDGVALSNGDLVLLTGQTTAAQNGPYLWSAAGSALVRATNWDTSAEAVLGSYWIVQQGSQADTFALLTNDTAITLGTTALTFIFRGAAGATYLGGAGLVLSGTTFDVVAGSTGTMTISADAVDVNTARVLRKWQGAIPAGSSTVDGLPITVSGSNVTFNHAAANSSPLVVVRYGSAGSSPGQRVEVDDLAGDANNVTLTLPAAPVAGAYNFMIAA